VDQFTSKHNDLRFFVEYNSRVKMRRFCDIRLPVSVCLCPSVLSVCHILCWLGTRTS